MLTTGTPINLQDSDLRPSPVTMRKLGDIVSWCPYCVLLPVFSLSLSLPFIWETQGRLRMKEGVSGGVCFILFFLALHSRIYFWTVDGEDGI